MRSMLDRSLTRRPVHPALWIMAGLMLGIELIFTGVEAGVLPRVFSRTHGFALFAFFDPLFEHARRDGAVTLNLLWSFLTHAFVHGGWLHVALNTAAFLGLGHAICSLSGLRAFFAIFAVSTICGALAFALIADFRGPMVGASGAVFGFLGAVTSWQEQGLRHSGQPRTEVWQRILGLIFINALLDLGLGGMLAWEAHLGGFVGGWLTAYAFPPRAVRAARA